METRSTMEYPIGLNMKTNMPFINKMVRILKQKNYPSPVLIATGSSGSIIAAVISSKLNHCPIVYLKKEGENNHGHFPDFLSTNQYIVVDDFIYSGKTLLRVRGQLIHKGLYHVDLLLLSGRNISVNFQGFFKEIVFVHVKYKPCT